MLSNYLKLAIRTLSRNKAQSLILIGGLATGMAACMLLLQYVGFELSFDDFHTKKDRIYRVVNERIQNGKPIQKGTITYPTIGPAMQRDYPEVLNHARIAPSGEVFIRYEDNLAIQDELIWADEHFFEIFDFPILTSTSDKLLDETNELVLTRSVADSYFPGAKGNYELVLDKEVYVNKTTDPYRIVAVCEDVPANSFLQFSVLGSFDTFIRYNGKDADESWEWSDFWHFIELKPETDVTEFESKLVSFSDQYFKGTEVTGSTEIFTLQPLNDAHLYSSGLEYEVGVTTNGKAVWSLLIIAFFILVIAWINYVNLASVRAIERAKEVGVRKVVGAQRSVLVGQFLTEAFVVNILALFIAWQLAALIRPWFALNFGLESSALRFISAGNYQLPLIMLAVVFAGVALSGAYPAWLLSSPHISNVLKGLFQRNLGGEKLRKGLVVFQFTASIALITATWFVSRQIGYMNSLDLGLKIDQVITVEGPALTNWDSTFISKMDALKGKLVTNPQILSVATSNRTVDDGWHGRVFNIEKVSDHPSGERFTSSWLMTDHNYAETYGLKPVEGRFFNETDHSPYWSQLTNIVINEAAVRMFGYASSEDAIGQRIRYWNQEKTIVGVLPDFHEMSLHHPIESLIFIPAYGTSSKLSLRVDGADMDGTIAFIKAAFDQFFPGNVFQYAFLNESYQRLYDGERRFGRILGFFTLLTIVIACLGLFGLASYMTFLRTKEIGIRKVLGASLTGIVTLLSKDFLKLVLIAILLAAPVVWYMMRQWLREFPYRIDIEWWVFAVAGISAVIIAFLTVSVHSVKAALMNPVTSLRSE
ncbi:MAG TPA: ABC transporter permease [Saprospiraceae bacterium]|nr:ABC transporter permease [Saprospiraceae bacterium]